MAKKTFKILAVTFALLLCLVCVLTSCNNGADDEPANTTNNVPESTTKEIDDTTVPDSESETTTEKDSSDESEVTTTEEESTEWVEPTPVDVVGFTIDENGVIHDPDGEVFVPFGTNILGPNSWGSSITGNTREATQDLDLLTETWKFNFIRLVIIASPSPMHTYYSNAAWSGYHDNDDIDKIVDAFTAKKVVVMLDVHDYIGKYPSSTSTPGQKFLEEKWTELAEAYKLNPYVWFNIMNEPGNSSGSVTPTEWLTAHEGAIQAIRKTGSMNIIVCDGHRWADDFGNTGADEDVTSRNSCILKYGPELLKYHNVMFAIHSYNWNFGYEKMVNFANNLKSQGMALLVGEAGVTMERTDANYDLKLSNINGFLGTIAAYQECGTGIAQWAWQDNKFGLTLEDTEECGGWQLRLDKDGNPENLSWVGRKLWNLGHGGEEDVEGYAIELDSVIADRLILDSTNKASFAINMTNIGNKTLPSRSIHVKVTLGEETILDEDYSKSVAIGSSIVMLTKFVTLPGGSFDVNVEITGAELPAAEEVEVPTEPEFFDIEKVTKTVKFTRTDPGYTIEEINPVLGSGEEDFEPWGKYAVEVTIKRTTMAKEEFAKLGGSFFANGTFMSIGKTTVVDDDTIKIKSTYKFVVSTANIVLEFRVTGAADGTNGSLATEMQFENVDVTSFSVFKGAGFDEDFKWEEGMKDWLTNGYMETTIQFWDDKATYFQDGKMILPSQKRGGVAFWLEHNEITPGASYYVSFKAWFGDDMSDGDSFSVSFKYQQYGQWIEIKSDAVESTIPNEYIFEVSVPDNATSFYVSVWKSETNTGTAYIDYIAVVEK